MEESPINSWLKQARQAGLSGLDIQKNLEAAGWSKEQINQSFATSGQRVTTETVARGLAHQQPQNTISAQPHTFQKKTILIAALAIIFILLIGGGVFAYTKGYLPNPFKTKGADQIVIDAFKTLAEKKSGEFGFNFAITAEPRSADIKPIDLSTVTSGSSEEIRSQDSNTTSSASQLRTGLMLYSDDNSGQYPDSLDEVDNRYITNIPKQGNGSDFGYQVSADKKSYTLKYTCLGGTNKGPGTANPEDHMTSCIEGQSTTFDTKSILSAYSQGLLTYLPADLNLRGAVSVFMNYDKKNPANKKGTMSFNGSYSSAGTTMNADLEARYKDGKTYIQIKQFPSLFFFDVSGLMNKWILFDPKSGLTDLGLFNVDESSMEEMLPDKKTTDLWRTELAQLARLAFEKDLITTAIEGKETLDGHPTNRILISINPAKIAEFIAAYRSDAKSRGVDITKYEPFLKNLEDPSIVAIITKLKENSTIKLWVDQSGSDPRKLEFSIVLAAPDKYEKVKDKQFRISVAATFNHLGEEPNVTVPSETITMDEVERMITGTTIEAQQFEKQRSAVSDLRDALGNYHETKGSYPTSLDALLEQPPSQTNANANSYSSYRSFKDNYFDTYTGRTAIPKDLYSNRAFDYSSSQNDYQLLYTINLPPEDEDSLGGGSYYTSQFVEGKNTANKTSLSAEAEINKDSDNDGLTDAREDELGTNKYLKDTDRDGFDDKTEVDSGHDPLKK